MSSFERDTRNDVASPVDASREDVTATGSSSDAEDSAAHIAKLVRRSTERAALPGPSSVAATEKTVADPPLGASPVTERFAQPPVAQPAAQPLTQRFAQPLTPPATEPDPEHASSRATPWALPARRQPPLWALVAGGAVAVVLIVSGFALSRSGSPAAPPAAAAAPTGAAPAYVVKVTDQITDCAGHSHGRTKRSFENHNCAGATRTLATGQVDGRPVLFVVSRIAMRSAEAAASIKQVLDASDTGNLNDLLREGKNFPGAPRTMPRSGYASVLTGDVVVVAEAGFLDGGPSSSDNPALRAAAGRVASQKQQ
jgi:hypothetical protein